MGIIKKIENFFNGNESVDWENIYDDSLNVDEDLFPGDILIGRTSVCNYYSK